MVDNLFDQVGDFFCCSIVFLMCYLFIFLFHTVMLLVRFISVEIGKGKSKASQTSKMGYFAIIINSFELSILDVSKNPWYTSLREKCLCWEFFGPYFPAFRLNTETYFVNLHIQFEYGKARIRKTPNTGTFYTVPLIG